MTSNPPAKISWEFKEQAVELMGTEESGRSVSQLEDGSLKVTQTTLDDTGEWAVLADNNLGQIARKKVILEVTPEGTPITVWCFKWLYIGRLIVFIANNCIFPSNNILLLCR